jgi:hypothetical protein
MASKRTRCEMAPVSTTLFHRLPQSLFDHIMAFLRLTESAPLTLLSRNWQQWVHQQQINLSSLSLNITDRNVAQLPDQRFRPLHNALLIGSKQYSATIERLATGLRDLMLSGWSPKSGEPPLLHLEEQELLLSGCIRFSRSPHLRKFVFRQLNPMALRSWNVEEVFPVVSAVTSPSLSMLHLPLSRNWTTSDDDKTRVMSRLCAIQWSSSLTDLQCHASFALHCCIDPASFKSLSSLRLFVRTPVELRSTLQGLTTHEIAMPNLAHLFLVATAPSFQQSCRLLAPMAEWQQLFSTMLQGRATLQDFGMFWDGEQATHIAGFKSNVVYLDFSTEDDWMWLHLPAFSSRLTKLVINSRNESIPKPPAHGTPPTSVRLEALMIAPSLLPSFLDTWPEACSALRGLSLGHVHFPNPSTVPDSVMALIQQKLSHVQELVFRSQSPQPVDAASLRRVIPHLKRLQFGSPAYSGPLRFIRDRNGIWYPMVGARSHYPLQIIQFWLDELRSVPSRLHAT